MATTNRMPIISNAATSTDRRRRHLLRGPALLRGSFTLTKDTVDPEAGVATSLSDDCDDWVMANECPTVNGSRLIVAKAFTTSPADPGRSF